MYRKLDYVPLKIVNIYTFSNIVKSGCVKNHKITLKKLFSF